MCGYYDTPIAQGCQGETLSTGLHLLPCDTQSHSLLTAGYARLADCKGPEILLSVVAKFSIRIKNYAPFNLNIHYSELINQILWT